MYGELIMCSCVQLEVVTWTSSSFEHSLLFCDFHLNSHLTFQFTTVSAQYDLFSFGVPLNSDILMTAQVRNCKAHTCRLMPVVATVTPLWPWVTNGFECLSGGNVPYCDTEL